MTTRHSGPSNESMHSTKNAEKMKTPPIKETHVLETVCDTSHRNYNGQPKTAPGIDPFWQTKQADLHPQWLIDILIHAAPPKRILDLP